MKNGAVLFVLIFCSVNIVSAGTISKPYTFSAGGTIKASEINSDFDTVYNAFNGSVSAANLAADAVTTVKILDKAVTYGKIQDAAGSRLIGNAGVSSGPTGEIALVAPLAFSGGALTTSIASPSLLGRSTGGTGVVETLTVALPLVVSGGVLTTSISAGSTLLGRQPSGGGTAQEISIVSPLYINGTTLTTLINTARLMGRTTAGTGVEEQLTVDSTLTLASGNLGVANLGITTGKINDLAVTDAKLAAVSMIPIGVIMDFCGSSAPTGWLLCDGSAVSRTTYSALNTIMSGASYPYGSGDGSTTFNLPDFRGRASFGKDNMGGVAANRVTNSGSSITGTTLGANGGAENVTLTTNEMPAHTHTISYSNIASVQCTGGCNAVPSLSGGNTATSSSTGGGAAHQNMPPTLIVTKIIRTGV